MNYLDQILQQKYDLEQQGKTPTKIILPKGVDPEEYEYIKQLNGLSIETSSSVKIPKVE